jgi:hypothetical protein
MRAAARAVIRDDGSVIWLTVYTEAGDAVPVGARLPLSPRTMVGVRDVGM